MIKGCAATYPGRPSRQLAEPQSGNSIDKNVPLGELNGWSGRRRSTQKAPRRGSAWSREGSTRPAPASAPWRSVSGASDGLDGGSSRPSRCSFAFRCDRLGSTPDRSREQGGGGGTT